MDWAPFIQIATAAGCQIQQNAPMAAFTSFRIGGPADVFLQMPVSAAAPVLAACHQMTVPTLLIGNGSNLLVGDGGVRGAVLRLKPDSTAPVRIDGERVQCDAGMSLQRLCLFAREQALSGLEFAYGIPGTVGGAVYMNAGAYGGEMADIVVEAQGLTDAGEPVTLSRDALALRYRHSALMDWPQEPPPILTQVTLALHRDDPAAIAARMKELLSRRQEKQPLEYPSAGSFFKRPEGHYAGALIEKAGLKGFQVGGAQVSEKHAGFVINRGGATAADVRALCQAVQDRVEAVSGVRLQPEVRFVGEF